MPIAFNCPSCQKKLTVKDEMAGKVAKCPCGVQLKIPQPSPAQAAPAQPGTVGHPVNQAVANPAATVGQGAASSAFAGLQTGPPAGGAPMASGFQPSAPVAPQGAPENLQHINPDFKIQCIQCGQQYPMRPDLFGQTVACKCGAPIRFDDPLGSGGAMINQDPLGLGAAMEASPDQPLAYQSVSKPEQSRQQARAREEEVLKMYIKDEEEFSKATKPVKRSPGAVANFSGGGANPELNTGMFVTGISVILGLIGLGVSMMIWPNAMGEMSWSEADSFNEFLMIILWGFYTGIALCVIGAGLGITACIIPGKIFYAIAQTTAARDYDDD